MNQYVLLTLAMLPPISILYYLLINDKKENNNTLVYQLFTLGLLLAVPIYYSEIFLIKNIFKESAFVNSFLVYSLIEEGAKFIVFIIAIETLKKNDLDTFKCILLATGVSLGIATSENIIYVLNYGAETAVLRALFAIPLHACCGILMGYFLLRTSYFASFIIPFLIHGWYDFFILHPEVPSWIAFIFIGVIAYMCYETINVVLKFHKSSFKKLKFISYSGLIKPGDGETHTINSFNDIFLGKLGIIIVLTFLIFLFFVTGLDEFTIGVLDNIRLKAIDLLGGSSNDFYRK